MFLLKFLKKIRQCHNRHCHNRHCQDGAAACLSSLVCWLANQSYVKLWLLNYSTSHILLTPGPTSLISSYDYSHILPVTFYWHQNQPVLCEVMITQILYQSHFTDTRANKSSYDYSNIIPVRFYWHQGQQVLSQVMVTQIFYQSHVTDTRDIKS